MSNNKRYEVILGSGSSHCCFEATVIDTARLSDISRTYVMCETFEVADAQIICDALNAATVVDEELEQRILEAFAANKDNAALFKTVSEANAKLAALRKTSSE